ncbi:hypothetical protein BD309DRAFT_963946 [Dichomitus squalens]|uniref:Uncharacterized protein n=1 Tax=Dichomitus squalens TaxID=114155 RepID=A0A4Q9PCZ2_9APHY|nr:hypothetical protein BD309DRAFT_963946 [Dichomitus squalens]TBU52700.1 hypothetical protein BD310DRAFT_939662 [Dichomitus squalens]
MFAVAQRVVCQNTRVDGRGSDAIDNRADMENSGLPSLLSVTYHPTASPHSLHQNQASVNQSRPSIQSGHQPHHPSQQHYNLVDLEVDNTGVPPSAQQVVVVGIEDGTTLPEADTTGPDVVPRRDPFLMANQGSELSELETTQERFGASEGTVLRSQAANGAQAGWEALPAMEATVDETLDAVELRWVGSEFIYFLDIRDGQRDISDE